MNTPLYLMGVNRGDRGCLAAHGGGIPKQPKAGSHQAQVNHRGTISSLWCVRGSDGQRGWWRGVWDGAAVSMVTCRGSFSDGLHHPHPGVRLCVPPRGPAHLHRAAQVCPLCREKKNNNPKAKEILLSFGVDDREHRCHVCFLLCWSQASHVHRFYFDFLK